MRILFVPLMAAMLLSCSQEDRTKVAASGKANSDLEQSIQARFAADAELKNNGLTVTANADKSEVILAGTVASEELRSRAVALAKETKPDLRIMDTIDVKPAEISRNAYTEVMASRAREKALKVGDKIGNSVDDAWLYTKVMTRLTTNSGASALKIHADVTDRVVTLRGQVDSVATKEESERIAKETDGVRSVNSLLEARGAGL